MNKQNIKRLTNAENKPVVPRREEGGGMGPIGEGDQGTWTAWHRALTSCTGRFWSPWPYPNFIRAEWIGTGSWPRNSPHRLPELQAHGICICGKRDEEPWHAEQLVVLRMCITMFISLTLQLLQWIFKNNVAQKNNITILLKWKI